MRQNQGEPSRGQQNATANAIAVRPPSISISEVPCSGAEDKTISELFASLRFELRPGLVIHDRCGDLRVVLLRLLFFRWCRRNAISGVLTYVRQKTAVVVNTPSPYFTLRRKLMEEASSK